VRGHPVAEGAKEHRVTTSAPGAAHLLVCVYYRVGRDDVDRAIARVRDIQRTLAGRFDGLRAQVLVRCEVRAGPVPEAPRDTGAAPVAPVAAADDTLMETYHLPLSAARAARAPAAVIDAPAAALLLQALEDTARPLAPLLRGARHVEVFLPCAS
jgi:hypothetical protein